MGLNLPLGFHHKAQADAIPQASCQQPHAKSAGVPQRVEQRRPCAQLVKPLVRPCQVVAFFLAGSDQVCAQDRVACTQGLRRVKCLRADLADMIDAHECPGQRLIRAGQRRRLARHSRTRPAGARLGKQGAQGVVGRIDQGIHGKGISC